jgi:hypothetical protein
LITAQRNYQHSVGLSYQLSFAGSSAPRFYRHGASKRPRSRTGGPPFHLFHCICTSSEAALASFSIYLYVFLFLRRKKNVEREKNKISCDYSNGSVHLNCVSNKKQTAAYDSEMTSFRKFDCAFE